MTNAVAIEALLLVPCVRLADLAKAAVAAECARMPLPGDGRTDWSDFAFAPSSELATVRAPAA